MKVYSSQAVMRMATTGSYSVTKAEQNAGVLTYMELKSLGHGFVATLTVVSGICGIEATFGN